MLASHAPQDSTLLARGAWIAVSVALGHFQTLLGLSNAALVPLVVFLTLQLPHPL